jgi:PQ loop repeat
MQFLLDIPIVMAFATWVWGDDKNVSPTFCVENLFSFDSDCWTRLIVKGLGIAIILGACLNKAPVMINIWQAKSTSGLSSTAVYGETLVYANAACYGLLSGHPITAYGENLALFVQSLIIVYLMWEYSAPPASLLERGIVNLIVAVYIVLLITTLPKSYYYLLMTSIMPVLFYSRGSQILETYRCQHTGAQSIVTNTMNLVGGLIRILTTIKEVGWDMAILGSYSLSCTLNLIVFLQFFYYRKNTVLFLSNLQSKKKKE